MTVMWKVHFGALYSAPLTYAFVSMLIPYCFGSYSCVVSSEVRECGSSSSVLLSLDCLGYLVSFAFPYNFKIFCSYTTSPLWI